METDNVFSWVKLGSGFGVIESTQGRQVGGINNKKILIFCRKMTFFTKGKPFIVFLLQYGHSAPTLETLFRCDIIGPGSP